MIKVENELDYLNKSDFTEDDVNQFVNNVWQDVGEAISEAQLNPGAKYLRNLAQDIVTIEFVMVFVDISDLLPQRLSLKKPICLLSEMINGGSQR